jgi:hypothetical protein
MIVERNDTRPSGREIKTSFSKSDNKYGPGMGGPSNRGDEAEAQKLDAAYYDKVNIGKTCDIAVLTGIDVNNTNFTSFDFGNWRKNGANNIFDVSPAVTLLSDNTKFKNGYSYVVQDYVSTAENSGGIKNYKSALDKIQSSMNGANQITSLLNDDIDSYYVPKTFIPRYRNFKLMSDYKIENLDSITFNFTFGQAHLFSGEEEVVKPILALANIFAPVKQPNDDGNIHGYSSPALKTVNEFLTRFYTASSSRLRGFMGQLGIGGDEAKEAATDAVKSMGQKVGAELGMTGKVSELADNLKEAYLEAGEKIAASLAEASTLFGLRVGLFVYPPFQVVGCKWEFDTENTDEQGFPLKGSITFTLNSLGLGLPSEAKSGFGYTDSNTFKIEGY